MRLSAQPKCSELPLLYFPDFFLRESRPWCCYERVAELSAEVLSTLLREQLADASAPEVEWEPPARELFLDRFYSLQHILKDGALKKGVPYAPQKGRLHRIEGWLPFLLLRAVEFASQNQPAQSYYPGVGVGRQALYPYGIWERGGLDGLVGVSPEHLFAVDSLGMHLSTVACAGTIPISTLSGDGMGFGSKEVEEQEWVVDGLCEALSSFGKLSVHPAIERYFPPLMHRVTPIEVALREPVSIQQLVEKLHPTAAVGVYPPRSDAGRRWLLEVEGASPRGCYGAPFAVGWPGGRSEAIVAIRAVRWERSAVEITAGCGCLVISDPEREVDEFTAKCAAIRRLFSL